jgi:hypothetical protein
MKEEIDSVIAIVKSFSERHHLFQPTFYTQKSIYCRKCGSFRLHDPMPPKMGKRPA